VCAGSRTGVVKLSCSILFIITRTLTSVPSFSVAATFTGTVVGVLDGDTIEVLNGHHAERIRLSGIDCPEKGQAFGKQAKHVVSSLVFGKQVTLQTHGLDKYGHTLADVLLPDGMNLNQDFVEQG
jgi:micrococcal nuclease